MPRNLREAYGFDETYEPEIRCCSELWRQKQKKQNNLAPLLIVIFAAAFVLWVL
jgi:hypothetical protein